MKTCKTLCKFYLHLPFHYKYTQEDCLSYVMKLLRDAQILLKTCTHFCLREMFLHVGLQYSVNQEKHLHEANFASMSFGHDQTLLLCKENFPEVEFLFCFLSRYPTVSFCSSFSLFHEDILLNLNKLQDAFIHVTSIHLYAENVLV